MRISLIQSDIIWEDKHANIAFYEEVCSGLTGKTDLVVLPEMCTTGFSMHAESLAETPNGFTMESFRRMACTFGFAIAGTYIGKDADENGVPCYNRAFFIFPDGQTVFYDKKHLFRMGEESRHYAAGNKKVIVSYLGWNIRLSICYDLRFPVWLRNVENEYDLLLVMANWPEVRRSVWTSLITARALENQAFVCGVNRSGTDDTGLNYTGYSMLVDAYGNNLFPLKPSDERIHTIEIHLDELKRFRKKFPVWMDADRFELR